MLVSFCLGAQAQQKQDVIVKRNGDKVVGTVRQISDKEVFYGEDNMPANVFRTLPLADVAAIIYVDGKVQTFSAPVQTQPATQPQETYPSPSQGYYGQPVPQPGLAVAPTPFSSPQEQYAKGLSDANLFFTSYNGAATGTLLTTIIVHPLIGLIPAIACASTPPKDHKLGIPPSTVPPSQSYILGYREAAHKKKKRKVWANFGIGCAVYLPLYLLLSAR
jgi:hypothetical protein